MSRPSFAKSIMGDVKENHEKRMAAREGEMHAKGGTTT